jgi:hypothetical protein
MLKRLHRLRNIRGIRTVPEDKDFSKEGSEALFVVPKVTFHEGDAAAEDLETRERASNGEKKIARYFPIDSP